MSKKILSPIVSTLLVILTPGLALWYGENCTNSAECHPYDGTVSCVNFTCGCNLGDDAVFEEIPRNQCVALVGALCFSVPIPELGERNCVVNARCNSGGGIAGQCECIPGFHEGSDRRCFDQFPSSTPTTAIVTSPSVTTTSVGSSTSTIATTTVPIIVTTPDDSVSTTLGLPTRSTNLPSRGTRNHIYKIVGPVLVLLLL